MITSYTSCLARRSNHFRWAVEPDRQFAGQLQAIPRFFMTSAELVSGLVALDAQDMEQLFDLRFQP